MVNQYTQVGGVTRTHDGNGNLSDDGTYLFGYDFENRLVQLTNKSTSGGDRHLPLRRAGAAGREGGQWRRHDALYPRRRPGRRGVRRLEHLAGAGTSYEDGIDQPRCMDRADISDVNGNSNTTEVLRFHYHQQALGCVTEMTQPTGAVVEWVTYDVYGQPTVRDLNGTVVGQSAVGNPYLYTGREYDAESGLYFYRARTYDPGTGRFLQRDPLGHKSGCCLHEYACSSPAGRLDPLGLDSLRGRYDAWQRSRAERETAEAALPQLRSERDSARARAEAPEPSVQSVYKMDKVKPSDVNEEYDSEERRAELDEKRDEAEDRLAQGEARLARAQEEEAADRAALDQALREGRMSVAGLPILLIYEGGNLAVVYMAGRGWLYDGTAPGGTCREYGLPRSRRSPGGGGPDFGKSPPPGVPPTVPVGPRRGGGGGSDRSSEGGTGTRTEPPGPPPGTRGRRGRRGLPPPRIIDPKTGREVR